VINFKAEAMSDHYVQCDAPGCNARSYVTTTLDTEKVLDWCGHHFNEYDEQLWPYVISIDDRRATLLKRAHADA
jgi:hypothetical protein